MHLVAKPNTALGATWLARVSWRNLYLAASCSRARHCIIAKPKLHFNKNFTTPKTIQFLSKTAHIEILLFRGNFSFQSSVSSNSHKIRFPNFPNFTLLQDALAFQACDYCDLYRTTFLPFLSYMCEFFLHIFMKRKEASKFV